MEVTAVDVFSSMQQLLNQCGHFLQSSHHAPPQSWSHSNSPDSCFWDQSSYFFYGFTIESCNSEWYGLHFPLSVFMPCVCEREREGEHMHVCVQEYIFMHAHVPVYLCKFNKWLPFLVTCYFNTKFYSF